MRKKGLTFGIKEINPFDKVQSYEICITCKGNGYFANAEELQATDPLKLCQHCDGNGYLEPINTSHGSIIVSILTKLKEFSFIVRKVLSKKIIMKFLPKLFFVKDESFDYAEKIEYLLKQANK